MQTIHDLLDRDDLAQLAGDGRTAAMTAFDGTATVKRYLELFESAPDQPIR